MIEQTGLTCPALVELLNLDKTLPAVTLHQVKDWKCGRYKPSPERAKQIEVVANYRKQLEDWFGAQG